MTTPKRLLVMLLALLIMTSLFTGCLQADSPPDESQAGTAQGENPVENNGPDEPETREITDMAGRTVTVPVWIESVFSTSSASAIFLYMVVPDKLLGWNYQLNDIEKSIILEKYHNIPNFGMGDAINYEAVIAANPTIAVNCGKINDAMISDCDDLSKKLGIPVVAVDNDLSNSAEAFRFMGELFGEEEHTESLAAYIEQIFRDIEALADIPEDERVHVYYGNGKDSLETAPKGSSHAQILDAINAVNVADLELGDGSRVRISAEQLLAWNPDMIIVNGEPKADVSGGSAAESILNNPDYASLKAVQELRVYGIPNAPFGWVDRPPGPNRLIGMRWFSALIYPDYIECDIEEEVHEFFELFYHIDLTDKQMETLLKGAV